MRDALARILASTDFDASPRSRDFLRFIVEETLAGRQESLTQSEIATRVFARRADFDPTVDPIVRIQAGRLRRSLERYYLLGGVGDPCRLELPRGSYVPVVRRAPEVPGPSPAAGEATDAPGRTSGGWPTVVVRPDSGAGDLAARFFADLALELGRYRDVQVVLDAEPGQTAGRERCFVLTAEVAAGPDGRRIAVRLVESRTQVQLWADELEDSQPPTPGFPTAAAGVVAGRVASEFGVVAQHLWKDLPPAASGGRLYDALLQSYRFIATRVPSAFAPALEALRRAVADDPSCALAWTQFARLHALNDAFDVAPGHTSLDDGLAFAHAAVHLDPTSRRAQATLGFALLVKGEIAAGRAVLESALAVAPDSFMYRETIGYLLTMAGDWERGPALVRDAIARNPYHLSFSRVALWADHLRNARYEAAFHEVLLFQDPVFFWRSLMGASTLGHLGRSEEARDQVAELLRRKPDFARRGRALIRKIVVQEDLLDRVVEGLARAGLRLD